QGRQDLLRPGRQEVARRQKPATRTAKPPWDPRALPAVPESSPRIAPHRTGSRPPPKVSRHRVRLAQTAILAPPASPRTTAPLQRTHRPLARLQRRAESGAGLRAGRRQAPCALRSLFAAASPEMPAFHTARCLPAAAQARRKIPKALPAAFPAAANRPPA